jgi:hypothetical protein
MAAKTKGLVGQSAGQINAWGPYEEYTYVTTPNGEYGLQAGWVLTFELVDKINRDTMEIEKVAKPVRTKATREQLDQFGVDLSKQDPTPQKEIERAAQSINIVIDGETFPGLVKQQPVPEDH